MLHYLKKPDSGTIMNSLSKVILVHGLAASLNDWESLQPDLCDAGFDNYAVDLPGHGLSRMDETNTRFSLETLYETFVEWVASLKLDPSIIIVGHSLGAYLAVRYGNDYPKYVNRLILISPLLSAHQFSDAYK